MSRRTYPPDYVDRETLAYRLSIAPGAVDQYVRRGLLPAPVTLGDALRWRWSDVDARLAGGEAQPEPVHDDPYLRGALANGEAAAARRQGPQ